MNPMLRGALLAAAALFLLGVLGTVGFVKGTGLSARATPGAMESVVARRLRALGVPGEYARLTNPVLRNEESVRNGMAHFADHCAVCHGNDGSGNTEMGKGMFPPAPDMRARATQDLGDGELFYIIEHGVRFTGMSAWGTGTLAGEESSWHLVNFIRHLPTITPKELEEMAAMNPRSPEEIRQEIEAERFLSGDSGEPSASELPAHAEGHVHE